MQIAKAVTIAFDRLAEVLGHASIGVHVEKDGARIAD